MMRSQLKPKLIFWRCIDILIREHIQVPAYYQISEMILKAINQKKKELTAVIQEKLKEDTKLLLDGLFMQEADGQHARYKLTLLKKLSQSTKPTQIKERAADLLYIAELYKNIKLILPFLDLGYEGIRYFANSVIKSDIFQLNQRSKEDRYVHVVAFITHQFYRLQDNLVDTLLTAVKSFENGAKRDHKEWCYEHHKTKGKSLKELTSSIDEKMFGFVSQIQFIIDDDKTDSRKLGLIKELLEKNKIGFSDIEQQWHDFKNEFDSGADDPHYYAILENRSMRLQNRVSPILKALKFQYESGTHPTADSIEYFVKNNGAIRHNAPISFLEDAEQKAVTGKGTFRTSLYKSLLFMPVAKAVKSGQFNLKHSYKYRSLDEYMISRDRWDKEKKELVYRAELETFRTCFHELEDCI